MKRLIFMFSFSVLFLISCSTTEVPFEHRYVINLVLKPDMKFQRAFVDSTYRLDVPVDLYHTGMSGAEILLIDENSDTFGYSESDTLRGLYYSNDSFCVEYGMKYLVNVSVEGEVISREVQVPDSVNILSPQHLDMVYLNNPPLLIWNSCEDCFENTYMIVPYITGEAHKTDSFTYALIPDTSFDIFSIWPIFWETDTMFTISVEAIDSNVCSYLKSNSEYDELKEGNTIGLIGAITFDTVAVWITE